MVRDIDVRNLIDAEEIKDKSPDQFIKFIQANYGNGLVKLGRKVFANDESPELTAILLGEIYAKALELDPEDILSEEGEDAKLPDNFDLDDVIVLPEFEGFIDNDKVAEVTSAALSTTVFENEDVKQLIREKFGEDKTDEEIEEIFERKLTNEVTNFIATWLTLNSLLLHNQSRNMSEDTGDAEVDFGNPDAAEDYDTWAEWQDKNAMLKSSWFRILKRD